MAKDALAIRRLSVPPRSLYDIDDPMFSYTSTVEAELGESAASGLFELSNPIVMERLVASLAPVLSITLKLKVMLPRLDRYALSKGAKLSMPAAMSAAEMNWPTVTAVVPYSNWPMLAFAVSDVMVTPDMASPSASL